MQFESAFQYTLQMADRDAVVRHRHILTFGLCQARQHVAACDNAAAALKDELVGCEIRREVFADYDFDIKFASYFLSKPTR